MAFSLTEIVSTYFREVILSSLSERAWDDRLENFKVFKMCKIFQFEVIQMIESSEFQDTCAESPENTEGDNGQRLHTRVPLL